MSASRFAVALSFAFVLGLSLWLLSPPASRGKAPVPKPSGVDEASLTGKVVVLKTGMTEHLALESVKVRRLGDHVFLVGKVVESQSGGEALKEKTVWQSLNEITQIIECDNAEAAKKTLEAMPKMWAPWGGPKGAGIKGIPATPAPAFVPK